MFNSVPYLLTDNALFITFDRTSYTVNSSHPMWNAIKQALTQKNWGGLRTLLSPVEIIKEFVADIGDDAFQFNGSNITLDGKPVPHNIAEKVLRMRGEGLPLTSYVNMLRKLRQNPSATSQAEAFDFLVASGLLIHEDGDIIAYKGVASNYFDIHSGTVDNHVGQAPKLDRGEVDDNRNNTCSFGYHVGSYQYAKNWAGPQGHLMLVKFNPKDIVSVPTDANCEKCRVCEYQVIDEMEGREELEEKEVYSDEDVGIEDGSWEDDDDPDYMGGWGMIWDGNIMESDGEEDEEDDTCWDHDAVLNDIQIEALNEVIRKRQVRSVSAFVEFVEDELGLGFDDEVRGALRQAGFGAWVRKVENLEK